MYPARRPRTGSRVEMFTTELAGSARAVGRAAWSAILMLLVSMKCEKDSRSHIIPKTSWVCCTLVDFVSVFVRGGRECERS